jgi:multiple sugar transport system substrate-binding protein
LFAQGAKEASASTQEPIVLDVLIAQYGPKTSNWFLGDGINGSNFVKMFEAANPDIKLNLEVVSWNDMYTVVSTRITNNNAPDILNLDTFADYVSDDLLLPVSDYCPDELYKDFFPSFIAQSVIDGTVWAELEDACQAILDYYGGEVYPWGIDMTTDEGQAAFSYYTWNNDGGFVDADGNWALNSDKNVEAVKFAIGLYQKGYTNPSPATQTRYDIQNMFAAGKMAMVIAPNQLPTYLFDKGSKVNFKTAVIPCNEGAANGSTGIMDRVMAFRDDSYPDQARRNAAIGKFLSFFYSKEVYTGWVSMEGFLPAVSSAVADLAAADPSFSAWLAVLDSCQFYPTAKAEWNDVKQGVIKVEQNALQGGDVKALLDELQAKVSK